MSKKSFDKWWNNLGPTIPAHPKKLAEMAFLAGFNRGKAPLNEAQAEDNGEDENEED